MKKKSLVGYGNKHAVEMFFGTPPYEGLSIPLILKKPMATCIIPFRITIEEIPTKRRKGKHER